MFRITAVLGSERQDTIVVAVDIQLISQLGGDCTSAGTESSGNWDNKVVLTRSPVLSVNLTLKTQ